jgi:uncharacterized protein YkwD
MKLKTTIAILLISFSMVGAQNQYTLSDTNVSSFLSTEQLDIVINEPSCYYNTLQNIKDKKVEQEEDEYIQNYEYPKFSQEKESEIQMVEIEDQPQVKKHPKVEHPNLIKLTQLQKQEFIDAHNKWRADVGVPPLTWNNDLENYAGEWAIENGKKNCKMQHRSDTDYGENLYWSSGMPFSPKGVVDSWGSEIEDYNDELIGDAKAVVGHYTQIVWRTTTEVGCAAFQCGKALLVVCNYNPAGNWIGQHPYKN